MAAAVRGPWMVAAPALGGLVIGLMARYGSEKIRGHGIPEAIEAILIGGSRMSPKVAVLKPLSSAISIGTGGPFGAEGPIIMTGGAHRLAVRAVLPPQRRGAQDAAGGRRRGRHDRDLRHAGRRRAAGGRAAAVRVEAAQLHPGRGRVPSSPIAGARCCSAPGRCFPCRGAIGAALVGPARLRAALGVIAGLHPGLLTKLLYALEDLFERLPIHWMWWPALGGLVVGLGGLVEPRALGVGYDVIGDLLTGIMPPRAVAATAGGQGGDLAGRAGVGHLGRRAGAAADPGRRAGLAGRACCCRGDAGFGR